MLFILYLVVINIYVHLTFLDTIVVVVFVIVVVFDVAVVYPVVLIILAVHTVQCKVIFVSYQIRFEVLRNLR